MKELTKILSQTIAIREMVTAVPKLIIDNPDMREKVLWLCNELYQALGTIEELQVDLTYLARTEDPVEFDMSDVFGDPQYARQFLWSFPELHEMLMTSFMEGYKQNPYDSPYEAWKQSTALYELTEQQRELLEDTDYDDTEEDEGTGEEALA